MVMRSISVGGVEGRQLGEVSGKEGRRTVLAVVRPSDDDIVEGHLRV
jgi:hypothetical protein